MTAPTPDWMLPGQRVRAATRQTLAQHRRGANGRFAKLPSQYQITHAGLRAELGMAPAARSISAPPPVIEPLPPLPPVLPTPPLDALPRRRIRPLSAAVAGLAVVVAVLIAIPVTWPALVVVAVVNLRAAVGP